MNRRKSEERKAWMILTLIIVLVLAAALFLTKDFREYLRDYEAFQKYKNYVAAQEKESVSGERGRKFPSRKICRRREKMSLRK